jgi:hypothetical protein
MVVKFIYPFVAGCRDAISCVLDPNLEIQEDAIRQGFMHTACGNILNICFRDAKYCVSYSSFDFSTGSNV